MIVTIDKSNVETFAGVELRGFTMNELVSLNKGVKAVGARLPCYPNPAFRNLEIIRPMPTSEDVGCNCLTFLGLDFCFQ